MNTNGDKVNRCRQKSPGNIATSERQVIMQSCSRAIVLSGCRVVGYMVEVIAWYSGFPALCRNGSRGESNPLGGRP